ncbi:MAG TPA: helix-turn-helix domain-containing protein [Deltaproteobacteria bacterium]|nr:helix-turn-helix domain-containing protein [Deltaproteobacteria bacterium]
MLQKKAISGEIGKRISQLRDNLGITQPELAKVLDIKRGAPTISNWENGISVPDVTHLSKISELYNVNLNWLITGKGEMRLGGESTSPDKDLKSAKKTPHRESDMREKLRQLEARMILIERILSESKPNPGRRFYDPLVAEKK